MEPSKRSPRLALRIAVLAFAGAALVTYAYVAQHRAGKRRMSGTKATQVLEDLRQIDSAFDQYSIEPHRMAPAWEDVRRYLKTGPRLEFSPDGSVKSTTSFPVEHPGTQTVQPPSPPP
jgi:hypothetical protein